MSARRRSSATRPRLAFPCSHALLASRRAEPGRLLSAHGREGAALHDVGAAHGILHHVAGHLRGSTRPGLPPVAPSMTPSRNRYADRRTTAISSRKRATRRRNPMPGPSVGPGRRRRRCGAGRQVRVRALHRVEGALGRLSFRARRRERQHLLPGLAPRPPDPACRTRGRCPR